MHLFSQFTTSWTVGNDQHGLPPDPIRQRCNHPLFGGPVEPFGGLVQQKNRRVLQKGPGQGDPAGLSSRHGAPPLAHRGIQTQGKSVNPLGKGCVPDGPTHLLLFGRRVAQKDILSDGAVEEVGLLGNSSDQPANSFPSQTPEFDSPRVTLPS